jgi:hypothetical protein
MLPADELFDGFDLSRVQSHDGTVVDHQLPPSHGAWQLGHECRPVLSRVPSDTT